MILDRIVRAAGQQLGDLGPAIAEASLRKTNTAVFIGRPRILPDGRI